jgi:hypothetical protein
LNKKLFNNRLQNDNDDLKGLVSGAKKDIKDIIRLLASLQHYRSSVSDMKTMLVQRQSQVGLGSQNSLA